MPHKFNAGRRDKIPKQEHRVTNWPKHNEGLRQRGDLTVWIDEDALGLRSAPRRPTRGGQRRYSDLAIELCLTLGVIFHQPLRPRPRSHTCFACVATQRAGDVYITERGTQGLMRSIAKLLEIGIAVPDFSAMSRRGCGLTLQTKPRSHNQTGIHLFVDSTGLKIFGEGEWPAEKHKTKAKRKSWRKLHLGLDLISGEIVCADLTTDNVGDPTRLPNRRDRSPRAGWPSRKPQTTINAAGRNPHGALERRGPN